MSILFLIEEKCALEIWFILSNYFDHQIGTLKEQYYLTLKREAGA